jgi:hypothetical protein
MDKVESCGYNQSHINRCIAIVDNCVSSLTQGNKLTELAIREVVNSAVIGLNDLNRECDYRLIETDQREYICEILLVVAQKAGIGTFDDITEELREW